MNKNYVISAGSNITVAELMEFLVDLPQDYIVSCCGVTEQIYLNVLNSEKIICIDEVKVI